jgi:methylthioribulose-1-phosphate dehydratase
MASTTRAPAPSVARTPFPTAEALGRELAAIGRRFYRRGWVLGTSGNFSAVLTRSPLRLLVTPSAAHKGTLSGRECLVIDERGRVVGRRPGRPSAEAALHLELARARGAGAVLHTHSVWGTILSDFHARQEGLTIHGYEMLKGLRGVSSHDHREWLPIVDNDQDMSRLASTVRARLVDAPEAHGFLLRAHGLYTWGETLAEAERHVEIFEFLLETVGRREMRHGHRENSRTQSDARRRGGHPGVSRRAGD